MLSLTWRARLPGRRLVQAGGASVAAAEVGRQSHLAGTADGLRSHLVLADDSDPRDAEAERRWPAGRWRLSKINPARGFRQLSEDDDQERRGRPLPEHEVVW